MQIDIYMCVYNVYYGGLHLAEDQAEAEGGDADDDDAEDLPGAGSGRRGPP